MHDPSASVRSLVPWHDAGDEDPPIRAVILKEHPPAADPQPPVGGCAPNTLDVDAAPDRIGGESIERLEEPTAVLVAEVAEVSIGSVGEGVLPAHRRWVRFAWALST